MQEDNLKKTTGFIVMIVVIAIMLPVFLRLNERMNNEIVTVYRPMEVGNSNITVNGNFTDINMKEFYINNSVIDESYSLNQSSSLQFDTFENISADISFNITNISAIGFTEYTYDNFSIISDVFNSISTSDNTYYFNDVIFLYQSFTLSEATILQNISLKIRAGGDDYTTDFAIFDSIGNSPNSQIALLSNQYSGLASDTKIIELNNQNISLESGTYFLKMSANNLVRVYYNSSFNNYYSYKGSSLLAFDFGINFTFSTTSFNVLDNISINNEIFNSNSSNVYLITNFDLNFDYLSISVNCNWTNVTYDLDLYVILYSGTFNRTLDIFELDEIILSVNNSNAFILNESSPNKWIYTVYNKNLTSIYAFSNDNHTYAKFVLPSGQLLSVNKTYFVELYDIELFESNYTAKIRIYENSILINTITITDITLYPEYVFV